VDIWERLPDSVCEEISMLGYLKKKFFKKKINHGRVSYINWHNDQPSWLSEFINYHFGDSNVVDVELCSVFGPRKNITKNRLKKRIFFSGENLQRFYKEYKDYCLDDVDVALGFDDFVHPKYMRFPLWMQYILDPRDSEIDIINKIKSLNKLVIEKEKKFSLIATHDKWGTRYPIFCEISKYYHVDCAGKLFNNTKELWDKYKNNKVEYLKQYMFNICPENTNTENYVTEKLFEALMAGSIPIYYGSNNNPEPGVLNKGWLLAWNMELPNDGIIKKINTLIVSKQAYIDFVSREKFTSSASDLLCSTISELKSKIGKLL
jgi:hypothetical protein